MDELITETTPPAVHMQNVSYAYPSFFTGADTEGTGSQEKTLTLDNVTLHINTGETVLLVGASGSGKSTCLRTMNALIPQFYNGELTGTVHINGTDVNELKLADMASRSAMVFQNPRTHFFTSVVRSEMALTLENLGVEPSRILETIDEVAKQTGITHLMNREIHGLSGGELQRVACACALVARVPLLLFDEPTSNLSPHAITQFRNLLLDMKRMGKTMVISEHRIHFMKGIADRVYRIAAGKLVGQYTGEEFFALTAEQRTSLGLRAFKEPALQAPQPPALCPDSKGLGIRNLKFAYKPKAGFERQPVLDISTMYFPAGKVTALCGPNGAGKSTLARIICGLSQPEKGATITLDGVPVNPKERMRACGIVMQDVRRQLFAESVADEITMGLTKAQKAAVDVPEILDSLDLSEFSSQHPAAISGGQQQRLVIGATMAGKKQVVIFDEPTSGVDAKHLRSIATRLRELADAGATVICITHDAELIQECADYAVYLPRLRDGAVISYIPPEDPYVPGT